MIKSMTGYGRGDAALHGRSIVVEVRSVNNRYLDCGIKLPRIYTFAEDGIRSRVQAATSRGKVDVYVTIDSTQADTPVILLNQPVAEGYLRALRTMAEEYHLQDDVSVSLLSRFPDVFYLEKASENIEEAAADIWAVLETALQDYDKMRVREGNKLEEDLLSRLDTIEAFTARVEERSPQTIAEYRARLAAKMSEVLSNTQLEESRILTEAAIYADKVAVDEETVRLRSHLAQFRDMICTGGAVGRKLDFLIQEMNRETNTIGSKGNDLEIARIVVDMKAEIEKIREQTQNIE